MFKFIANKHNLNNLENTLRNHIKAHYSDDNYVLMVTAIPNKSKRSNEANRLYWAFLGEFGNHLGYDSEFMHDLMRYKFLFEIVNVLGEESKRLKSTTKLDTKEMADYFENCLRFAAEHGFLFDVTEGYLVK